MCNIKSSYKNADYYYDALFINGVLCKKYPYQSGNPSGAVVTSETTAVDEISNKIRFYYNFFEEELWLHQKKLIVL